MIYDTGPNECVPPRPHTCPVYDTLTSDMLAFCVLKYLVKCAGGGTIDSPTSNDDIESCCHS